MKMRLNSGWTLFTLFCHEVVIENYEIAWEIILGLSSLFLISFEKRRISISTIVKLFFFFKIGKGEIFLINNLRLYSYFCIMGYIAMSLTHNILQILHGAIYNWIWNKFDILALKFATLLIKEQCKSIRQRLKSFIVQSSQSKSLTSSLYPVWIVACFLCHRNGGLGAGKTDIGVRRIGPTLRLLASASCQLR